MTDNDQEQFDTLLANTEAYRLSFLTTLVDAIDQRHLSPDAAVTTLFTVAAQLCDEYLGGVDAFEFWAKDYVEFGRNKPSEIVQ